jgi:hypothetical protein
MSDHCENCKHFDHEYRYCELNGLRDIPTPNCRDFKKVGQ